MIATDWWDSVDSGPKAAVIIVGMICLTFLIWQFLKSPPWD